MLLTACCDTTKPNFEGKRVDFADKNKVELQKENVICQFIPLETTDSSLFEGIESVEISEDRIFIINNKCDKVLVFDRTGKFITQIGGYGTGPGEYLSPYVLHIDNKNKRISIADRRMNKLLHYRLDNYEYISSQSLFNFTTCVWLPDGNIAWFSSCGFKTDKRENYYLKITDSDIKEIGYIYPTLLASFFGVSAGHPIYKCGGNAFLNIPYLPNIQMIKTSGVSPVYQFSFGSHYLPPLDWLQDIAANNTDYAMKLITSHYISAYNVKETDSQLAVFYLVGGRSYIGFYDKENDVSYKYITEKFLEITELYGLSIPSGVYNDYFIATIQPGALKDSKVERQDIKFLSKKIAEDDNLIICLFKIETKK